MKKSLLLSGVLLFMGANLLKAQMDERFNDGKVPYGWYADGWTVKDGAAQKGSSSGGFSMPGSNSDEGFTYLMTPPLKVSAGENLVFSAKKSGGGGMDSFMGSKDSTFVVERCVYGQHKWIQVADFTTEVETDYKTFTVSGTEAGEYRFRFRSGNTVLIDSVAGFTVDTEAPDILVIDTVGDAHGAVKMIDFSLCYKDSVKQVLVVNTATGKLVVNNSMSDAAKFSFSKSSMEIAGGDSLDVDVKFLFAAGQPGKNESLASFKPSDSRVEAAEIMAYAIVTEPGVWMEDFNGEAEPKSWVIDGWTVEKGVAHVTEPSGGAAFGMGGSAFYLTTPPVTVAGNTQALIFSVKDGDDGGGMGGMMGGGSSSPTITVEKTVYGSNKWEKVKVVGGLEGDYRVKWISGIEPGDYRFRFVASDSIVIDSVAGFQIKDNAPDMYITQEDKAVNYVFYGLCKSNVTKSFKVYNSGTGAITINLASTSEFFNVKTPVLDIPASSSVNVDVEFLFESAPCGENSSVLVFAPQSEVLTPQYIALRAYKISNEAWSEDFDPEYVVEDESEPLPLPEGWESTGWQVSKPSGGMMDMIGGGDSAPKSWQATTDSKEYELITPRLQALQGDVLSFDVEIDAMAGMMGSFSGGDPSVLMMYYRRDVDSDWTLYNYFARSETVYFKAPYSGIYRLKFTGTGSLDNFLGFTLPAEPVALIDGADNSAVIEENDGKVVNVTYDREFSAEQAPDGTWQSRAYAVSLPYDFNFNAYYSRAQVGVYRLDFVDEFYGEYVFTRTDGNLPSGTAALVVVNEGFVNLSAVETLFSKELKASDVYAYGAAEPSLVGTWQGNFDAISEGDERAEGAYAMDDQGNWKPLAPRLTPEVSFRAFRAFMKMNEAGKESYRPMTRQTLAAAPESAQSRVRTADDGVEHDGLKRFPAQLFSGDLPGLPDVTGITTVRTVEADGSQRYFDLQGRELGGEPERGYYIVNGKKFKK